MGVGQKISAQNAGWTFGGEVPDTFVDHIKLDLLGRAGLKDMTTIQKYLCFEGFLAIK